MKRLASILCLMSLSSSAPAQLMTMGVSNEGGAVAYSGPGDVVSGWKMWGGLRAFSSATRGTKAINVCDAGNVCNDVNTDAVTGNLPASITANATNCSGGGCNVKIIYDKTGNNLCSAAPCDLTQSGAVNLRPTLTINCIGTNNRWCLTFAGSQAGQLMTTAFGSPQGQPMTLSFILQGTNNSTQEYFTDASSYQVRHTVAAGSVEVYDGSGPFPATMSDAAFHAMQIVLNGTGSNYSAYIDGTSTPLANTNTPTISTIDIAGGLSLPCNCKMSEFGIFNGALTTPQMSSLNSNQHTWGGF